MPATEARHVFDALTDGDGGAGDGNADGDGDGGGIRLAGFHALDSCRIEKKFLHFGHDVAEEDTPLEAGVGFVCDFQKPVDFIGRDALLRQREQPLRKRLVQFLLEDPEAILYHHEPILRDGSVVGHLTSGNYGHTLGGSVGLGYVRADEAVTPDWIDGRTIRDRCRGRSDPGAGKPSRDVRPDGRPCADLRAGGFAQGGQTRESSPGADGTCGLPPAKIKKGACNAYLTATASSFRYRIGRRRNPATRGCEGCQVIDTSPQRRAEPGDACMKAADAIAEILKREGVDTLIGYPVNHILEHAARADIRPVIVRQERIGLHMADAMARLSSGDRIGVFAMQHGPGAENAFGGVAQAFGESVPILVMPMGYPRDIAHVRPNFNSTAAFRPVTKSCEPVSSAAEIPNVLRRAFTQLRNGRPGPRRRRGAGRRVRGGSPRAARL